jgi:hypothetical protein
MFVYQLLLERGHEGYICSFCKLDFKSVITSIIISSFLFTSYSSLARVSELCSRLSKSTCIPKI